MPTINPTLPTIGDLNLTEDVDVRNALQTIVNAINGGLDKDNLAAAAGILQSQLAGGILPSQLVGFTGIAAVLPVAPVDGQICFFQDAVLLAPQGAVWMLRYRASSGAPYKWEFIGGPPLLSAEVAAQQGTNSAGYTDLTTVGPSIDTPLAGDYDVIVQAELEAPSVAGVSAFASFAVGGVGAVDDDGLRAVPLGGSGVNVRLRRERRKTAIAAATTLRMKYRTTDINNACSFALRQIGLRPVRLG